MKNTKIEWCDHTFNPWIGCAKVSPACDHCYAERYGKRFGIEWGPGKPRKRTSAEYWQQPLRWNQKAYEDRLVAAHMLKNASSYKEDSLEWARSIRRQRVFCGSLCDWLDDEAPAEWLADLLCLINDTPNLDWLLLTKRPENYWSRIEAAYRAHCVEISDIEIQDMLASLRYNGAKNNVWLGVTVCNQAEADEKIPVLLQTPAAKRFISIEPMLSPVDLTRIGTYASGATQRFVNALTGKGTEHSYDGGAGIWEGPRVDWVICGGETGPGARPMYPGWVRSLRDQCQAANVPFFFKGWGDWIPEEQDNESIPSRCNYGQVGIDGIFCSSEFYLRDFSGKLATVFRVGKKIAGRLLDGRQWNETP